MLGHRAGDVHQAEHHRLRDRLRHRLEAAVADIERVDKRDQAGPALLAAEFGFQFLQPRHQSGVGQRDRVGLDRRRSRPSSWAISSAFGRFSAIRRDRLLRMVRLIEVGRRAADRVAGARQDTASASTTLRLARSGSSRSSRNRSRNSSCDRANWKASWPSPSWLPSLPLARRRRLRAARWCRLRCTACCPAGRGRGCPFRRHGGTTVRAYPGSGARPPRPGRHP